MIKGRSVSLGFFALSSSPILKVSVSLVKRILLLHGSGFSGTNVTYGGWLESLEQHPAASVHVLLVSKVRIPISFPTMARNDLNCQLMHYFNRQRDKNVYLVEFMCMYTIGN